MKIKYILVSVMLLVGFSSAVSADWASALKGVPNGAILGESYNDPNSGNSTSLQISHDDDLGVLKISAYNTDPVQTYNNVDFKCSISEGARMYPTLIAIYKMYSPQDVMRVTADSNNQCATMLIN
ncbi:MAG: hypothetical protein ACC653_11150 [Gammaproteobacteria bacterium]